VAGTGKTRQHRRVVEREQIQKAPSKNVYKDWRFTGGGSQKQTLKKIRKGKKEKERTFAGSGKQ